MRTTILAAMMVAGLVSAAAASPLAGILPRPASDGAEPVQFSQTRSQEFNRCMRAKYGPRYYRGVKRAHRYFMAQACGG